MKTRWLAATVVALMLLSFGAAQAGDEKPWFDLENCSMCKNLLAEEGLLEHMSWEHHIIANGALSFTSVEPEYKAAFDRASKNMQAVGAKLMAGEQLPLCGYCMSYGGLMMSGAKVEMVNTKHGDIMLITSTDPATVKKIQAHTQRTIDEYAKAFGAAAEDHEDHEGHEGHGHK